MNKVILIGRLTKDPEVRNTSNQTAFCNFSIAVDRRFKDNNGQRQADFINCVAWRQTASFIGSYFRKGSKIAVVGSLQTRTYDDNQGQKRYVTEVVVEEAEFADSANSGSRESAPVAQAPVPAPSSAPAPEAPKAPAAPIDVSIYEEKDDGNGELPFDI
ncbi:MAG: single-stranded DNA-binding protein [Clostridia bacterium]|nr:single-stranded DNA-binding protein [Clostridiales bacterium]MCR5803331.1 single-stranded DNA-binding protein [Clostridia bacterium]